MTMTMSRKNLHWWWRKTMFLNISEGQHVYYNSRGPDTDPCGTP